LYHIVCFDDDLDWNIYLMIVIYLFSGTCSRSCVTGTQTSIATRTATCTHYDRVVANSNCAQIPTVDLTKTCVVAACNEKIYV
jgi:hypothetical protein